MKREIKFRAWDTEKLYMCQVQTLADFACARVNNLAKAEAQWKRLIPMQYTGLLDKNGKEIYENDYLETGGTNVWWVVWGSGKYILQNISNGDIIDLNEDRAQRNEVAGNSFESPREHKAMETDL